MKMEAVPRERQRKLQGDELKQGSISGQGEMRDYEKWERIRWALRQGKKISRNLPAVLE